MKTYSIHYFGILADLRGTQEECFSSQHTCVGTVFDEVFPSDHKRLRHFVRAVVNDEIVSWDHALQDEDRLAFLPPMSGG